MTVRTRIAPSPTGFPHVGTAYIALFNYVFAKAHGGEFILRIEDTDAARSSCRYEHMILDALKWLGLFWSEGPDIGGNAAPYRQSERADIYAKYAQQLLDEDHAFRCFCTPQELDEMRAQQMARGEHIRYDGRYKDLDRATSDAWADEGRPFVVRMRVPQEGDCVFEDMLRGEVSIPWDTVDMQILLKADGLPTYHLANVVDDHLMQITHVIRGEEWLSSAPKHQLLYRYFGWQIPKLCHLPLLRNVDKSKLSKRKNPTSITYYKDAGVLPQALLNYLGRMGYSLPSEAEKFSLDEMIASFDIKRVSLGGPVFDMEKLTWLNGQYIQEMTPQALKHAILTWAHDDNKLTDIARTLLPRINLLSDAVNWAAPFFLNLPDITPDDLMHKNLSQDEVLTLLQYAIWTLESQEDFSAETIRYALTVLAKQMDVKFRDFIAPFFVAITGKAQGVPVMDAMATLGADMTLARLRNAITILGGIGKKKQKSLEKAFLHLSLVDDKEQ